MTQALQRELFEAPPTDPTTASMLFAEVVFDRPLDHPYTYSVSSELAENIRVGKRVQVPFGKGDRATVGFCVRVHSVPPDRAVKAVQRVIDEESLLTPELMRLTRWMADYYLCGWGQVLNAVLPAGARHQAGTRSMTFVEAVPEAELSQPPPTLTAKQDQVLQVLRKAGKPLDLKKLTRLAKVGSGPIKALIVKGVARQVSRRIDTGIAATEEAGESTPSVALNGDQKRAWEVIKAQIGAGGFHAFLLHGVTGSGKTEVYLKAIKEVVKQGKQALMLVPEISLTPQTISRFRGRFGEVAVLHSHLSDAERGSHWRRVASGEVQVVVGARSAVFAPTKNLGLIVIDEEHETTFKQEATPRYHGRDVAVMRARLEEIPILLGSATPSLESWHNAQRGQYTLLTLPSRVLDRPLPKVGLIDLRHDMGNRDGFHALSLPLERAMRDALTKGGQVMLLLNRRGFSTHVHCPACGHVESCQFCDLALTFHRERAVMLCHCCGYEAQPPRHCPECGEKTVRYQGLGTEKLTAEVEEKFHGFVVRRMDSDTMKRPGSHARVLAAFREGLIHILVGTQMIAKGLDFPNVTLVGVVNADIGLHIPDFRSAERTFQLLSQVAGRTGRGPQGGRVLVQTFNPEQPCVSLAATHDYTAFVTGELSHRLAHSYPPYQRLARLIVRSREREAAEEFAEKLAAMFQEAKKQLGDDGATLRILGPAEAPVFRLKGYYRYHFQLQSPSAGTLHRMLRLVLPAVRPPAGVEHTLDVDPCHML